MVDEKNITITPEAISSDNQTVQTEQNTESICKVCKNARYIITDATQSPRKSQAQGRITPCHNCFFQTFSPFFIKSVRQ